MRYSVLKRKMNFLSLTKIWSVLNNAWNKGEFLRSCFFIPCCWLVLKKWQSKNTTFFSEAWCKEWIKIITQLRIMSNKQFLELLYSTHYTLVFITGTLWKMEIKVVQSRPIQMRIYHSNERCRISAILRHRGKLF